MESRQTVSNMGGVESTTCTHSLQNPDLLSVVTLSDAAVQRLPLAIEDNPLGQEQRNQNIDDFWRDRLECLEQVYADSKRLTEKEFQRLEFAIKKMAPASGKLNCPRMVEDTATCYLTAAGQSLNCSHVVKKLELCLDTLMQNNSRKRYKDSLRKAKKRPC